MKTEKEKKEQRPLYNAEITKQDKDMLNQDNIHGDGGDDQFLKDRKEKVDFAGEDLDVPGRNTAKKGHGPKGLKDEENGLYSQGGDAKNNLEEDAAGK